MHPPLLPLHPPSLLLPLHLPPLSPLSPYSLRLPSSSSSSFLFFIMCIHPSSFLFLTSSLTFLSALHPLSLLPHLHPSSSFPLPSLSFIPIHLLPPYSPLFPSSFDLEISLVHPLSSSSLCASSSSSSSPTP